jgi:alanyl-tRNA synthetase
VIAEVPEAGAKELRGLVDELKQRLGSGVVLLAARSDGKVALALGVTPDLSQRYPANNMIKEIAARVGGTGGGRADFAQAGGGDVEGLPRAVARLEELIATRQAETR